MNCTTRILPHLAGQPERLALWTQRRGPVSFADFGRLAGGAQRLCEREGLVRGDAVLLLATPGPEFFATAIGLIGRGITVVFVEPWLPLADIRRVLAHVRPGAFVGSRLAQLWALRVPEARAIRRWIHIGRVTREAVPGAAFRAKPVDPDSAAILTFTSGTTGAPKGIVRSHRCMWDLHEILMKRTGQEDGGVRRFTRPELCVFPNLALLHLGTGRGALLVPPSWKKESLRRMAALPAAHQPETLTCGPAFLRTLLETRRIGGRAVFPGLRSLYVGGAQTDCWILERAFRAWPEAHFTHVYGGTEAEPVALADARVAVARSRSRGHFQTLFIGDPIPELSTRIDEGGLWVNGPNVAAHYPAMASGGWHCMGDRVVRGGDGWWFAGRAAQPEGEFETEQRIYARLGTSACFLHRDAAGRLILFGERVEQRASAAGCGFADAFPEVDAVRDLRVARDRRHRARIDRAGSLRKGGYDVARA